MAGERKPKSNVDDQERALSNDSSSPISSEQDQFTPPNNRPRRLDMSQHLTIGGDTAPAAGTKDTQPIPKKQFQPWDPTKPPSADFLVRWNDPSTWLSTPTGPSTTQDVTMTDATPTRTAEQTPEDNSHDQTLSVEDASRSKSKATQLYSVTKGVEEIQMQPAQTGHSGSKGQESLPK